MFSLPLVLEFPDGRRVDVVPGQRRWLAALREESLHRIGTCQGDRVAANRIRDSYDELSIRIRIYEVEVRREQLARIVAFRLGSPTTLRERRVRGLDRR